MNGLTDFARDLGRAATKAPARAQDVLHASVVAIEQASPPGAAVDVSSAITEGAATISGPVRANIGDLSDQLADGLGDLGTALLGGGR